MDKQKEVMALCLFCAVICSPVFTEVKIKVPRSLNALRTSCVVIPCSFTPLEENFDSSSLKGIWYHPKTKIKEVVYDEDESRVDDKFKGRTKLLGHLGQTNCTLEMMAIAEHDAGQYCFTTYQLEKETNCVQFHILYDTNKPLMSIFNEAVEDQPYTLTCSIRHTCPSNAPQLTWNRDKAKEVHKPCVQGDCEVVSILTIIPKEEDDRSDIICTANFQGGLKSSASHKLYVKRETGLDLEEPLCLSLALVKRAFFPSVGKQNHNNIIIPVVVAVVTAGVFGVFCFIMVKKYKRRITELQSQEGSMWNRLSRLSRRHRGVHLASSDNQKFSKSRFPSPKSQRTFHSSQEEQQDDDDEYVNTADLNIYGNL
ncbi:sialic acid-binding Ig-like lectin 13 isoform X2 [Nelusetta ayraudi]|uniref:sialic acid-binding Ig-like lectin 13 isoform X2 n=1 Tax=Nelusetta ayraudi TaxID=303726 RepID=UPI003F6E8DFC